MTSLTILGELEERRIIEESTLDLEKLTDSHPFTFIDTNFFLKTGPKREDLLNIVMDCSNYKQIHPLAMRSHLGTIKKIYDFMEKQPFYITRGILAELKETQKNYMKCLKYFNQVRKTPLRRRRKKQPSSQENETRRYLEEYGLYINRMTKKARHHLHIPQKRGLFHQMISVFEGLQKSNKIDRKNKKLNNRRRMEVSESTTDPRLIAHAIYASVIQQGKTAIISNDKDINYYLTRMIRTAISRENQGPHSAQEIKEGLRANPIAVFRVNRSRRTTRKIITSQLI